MSTRQRYGLRSLEAVEGGVVAWLHPGGADLDEVMVEVVRYLASEDVVDWWEHTYARGIGPDPEAPPLTAEGEAWAAWSAHLVPGRVFLMEEYPTETHGDITVGWFRRFPWCHCGDGHDWHIEEASGPGRGASLAVMLSWYC